jgi:urease accessory protein
VTVVECVYRSGGLPDAARAFARDTLTLGWEERSHVHGRWRTDGGVEFATSLPRGTMLREGDCLALAAERLVVSIVEREEPVFVVEPRTPREWGRFAYHIGNRHLPLMLTDAELLCPDVPGMEQLLEQHEIPYTRAQRRFTPEAPTAGHRH